MALVDERGRLFGRVNVVDFVIGIIIVLMVAGVFLVQSGTHITSGQVVEGETDIVTTILIPNLKSMDSELFQAGKMTAITIRNQPRGEVLIQDVKKEPVRMTMMTPNGQPQVIQDIAQQNALDYTLQLKDHAKITKDGYVAGGVKVKVGLPIELEGFKYRVYGKIVDVQPLKS